MTKREVAMFATALLVVTGLVAVLTITSNDPPANAAARVGHVIDHVVACRDVSVRGFTLA